MNAPTQTRPTPGTAMTPAGNAGAVAKQPTKFEQELAEYEPQIAAALPAHIRPERFRRIVVTAINQNPDLLKADRRSLFNACIRAANDGLLPDGREGALVVFNTKEKVDGKEVWVKKVQWMPMIQGILKRARNTGELVSAVAHVVYEHDTFSYRLGDEESLEHVPLLVGERGRPIGAYAIAKLKDGTVQREFMRASEIEEVRKVSKNADSANGPWAKWWGEMARKTVARRLFKWLPTSSELTSLFDNDDTMQIEETAIPPRPTRAAIAAPAHEIEGEAAEEAPPATFEYAAADGEIMDGLDAQAFADAFILDLRRAPGEGEVQGIWETNSKTLDALRAIGPEGVKLADEIAEAYGEELDAKRKAEHQRKKASAPAAASSPPAADREAAPAEGADEGPGKLPADDALDGDIALEQARDLYQELRGEVMAKATAQEIHGWFSDRKPHLALLRQQNEGLYRDLRDAADARIRELSPAGKRK